MSQILDGIIPRVWLDCLAVNVFAKIPIGQSKKALMNLSFAVEEAHGEVMTKDRLNVENAYVVVADSIPVNIEFAMSNGFADLLD